jgi:hypothetical protein
MQPLELLAQGDRELPDDQQQVWARFAVEVGVSPYVCKAAYACGVLREQVHASGLCY